MKRFFAVMLICSPLALLAGCAMCCSPFDYSYPTYGGKWQRVDREHGRVGSVFTPHAGIKVEEGESVTREVVGDEGTEEEMEEMIEGELIEQDSFEVIDGSVRLIRPAQ